MSAQFRLGGGSFNRKASPANKDCSNTFLERSIIYAAPCEWNKLSEHIRTSILIVSERELKQCYLHNNMMLTVNVYIIVTYVVVTVNYCKCILL